MKIIMIFCDPIKRLKSDFMHVPLTKEPHNEIVGRFGRVGSFVDAYLPDIKNKLSIHGEKYITDIYKHDIVNSLFTNSIYVHHLKHWLKFFPKEQILILDGEEILKPELPSYAILFFLFRPRSKNHVISEKPRAKFRNIKKFKHFNPSESFFLPAFRFNIIG